MAVGPPDAVLVAVSAPDELAVLISCGVSDDEADTVGTEAAESWDAPMRFRIAGLGKLAFLSTASTVRWKRRKRDSALISVDSRSMALESSLTLDVSHYDP